MTDTTASSGARRFRRLRRAAFSSVIDLALRALPPRRQVLVYGWPDSEGNATALLRFLARESGERRVVWLTNGPAHIDERYAEWVGRVVVHSKRSVAGLLAYLRSDVVCFTHGLYGSPQPRRGRVFINLWHGDGPKRTQNPAFVAHPGATAVVGQTRLWGEKKAVELGMPASSVLVVGNPRIDDLDEPMTVDQRRALAELLGPRFVLWMPTYRDSNGAGQAEWRDARPLSATGGTASVAAEAQAAAEQHGVTVVVRPHPMDRDSYSGIPGLRILDDDALQRIGVSLYQVLGASVALITDYSSVWTDYLPVDRPVLLFCPDYDEYATTRGFNVPDLAAVAPGPLVRDAAAVSAFIADVAAGRDPDRVQRHEVVHTIGGVTSTGASRRLWDAVSELRRSGARRPQAVPELVG